MNMNMPRVVHCPGLKAVTNSRGLLGTSYQETKSVNRFLLHWQRVTRQTAAHRQRIRCDGRHELTYFALRLYNRLGFAGAGVLGCDLGLRSRHGSII